MASNPSVQPSPFKCNNCQEQILETVTLPHGKLERCPNCHSMLLDTELLIAYAEDKESCANVLREDRLLRLPTSRQCPRCFDYLFDGRLRSRAVNLVECPTCKGLWIDFATIRKLDETMEVTLRGVLEKTLFPDESRPVEESPNPSRPARVSEGPDKGMGKLLRGVARSLDGLADKVSKPTPPTTPPATPPTPKGTPKVTPKIVTPQPLKPKPPAPASTPEPVAETPPPAEVTPPPVEVTPPAAEIVPSVETTPPPAEEVTPPAESTTAPADAPPVESPAPEPKPISQTPVEELPVLEPVQPEPVAAVVDESQDEKPEIAPEPPLVEVFPIITEQSAPELPELPDPAVNREEIPSEPTHVKENVELKLEPIFTPEEKIPVADQSPAPTQSPAVEKPPVVDEKPAPVPPAPLPPAPFKKVKEPKPPKVKTPKKSPAPVEKVPAVAATPTPAAAKPAPIPKPPKQKKVSGPSKWPSRFVTLLTWLLPAAGVLWNIVSDEGFDFAIALGWALIGWGIGRIIQLWKLYPRGEFPETHLADLRAMVFISRWKSIPVLIKGQLRFPDARQPKAAEIAEGGQAMALERHGTFELLPRLFGIAGLKGFANQEVTLRGWYRRRGGPSIEIFEVSDGQKSQRSLVRRIRWSSVIALLVLVAGLLLVSD